MSRVVFYLINAPKYLFNLTLQRIFNFHPWHISTLSSRQYCLDIIKHVNSEISDNELVVEMGCGLGETLSKINSKNKIGLDTSVEVIKAAKFKNLFSEMKITEGSFQDLEDLDIKFLLAVNFLHDFKNDQVKEWFKVLLANNRVSNIIVDELSDSNYFCLHDFSQIIPKTYKSKIISDTSIGKSRVIKVFSKMDL